ncbi:glycerophosphodiester phosphodiesterase [Metabacillus idriensis]|nr:glycerophosphodiester phosphodiesterase [Metabacillus idriensis]MCM3598344.1 glycerophosphodiester phosphodiesterase [Metabacillus idriensis]
MSKRVEIYAHRGCSGEYPENTMAAFEAACEIGADGIELDVQMTKDGEVVVIHDERIDRTTNGIGFVKDFRYKQLKLFDAGSWFHPKYSRQMIPSLQDVLDLIKTNGPEMNVNIELKNDVFPYEGLEEKVLQCIHQSGMADSVILSSFQFKSMGKIRELESSIQTALLFEGIPSNIIEEARKVHANALHSEASFAVSAAGKRVVDAGYPLRVFTINQTEKLETLTSSGVSALITDYPELFLENKSVPF